MNVYLFQDPRQSERFFMWDTGEGTLSLGDRILGELQRHSIVGELLFRFLDHPNLDLKGRRKAHPNEACIVIKDFRIKLLNCLGVKPKDRPLFIKNYRNVGYEWLPKRVNPKNLPGENPVIGVNDIPELVLTLHNPNIREKDGQPYLMGTAQLIYSPPSPTAREVKSALYPFELPPSPIKQEDLHWYLAEYHLLPLNTLKERAERIARQLPSWGKSLYQATLMHEEAQDSIKAWLSTQGERRFTLEVAIPISEGQAQDSQIACRLLNLPWELLHDSYSFLFQGYYSTRIRRRPLNRKPFAPLKMEPPIRILLICPRPAEKIASFPNHRSSSKALLGVVEYLGQMAELTVLNPPTLSNFRRVLSDAHSEKPFHVVHFDGQGQYDPDLGLGVLYFEHPDDISKPLYRRSDRVSARKIAAILAEFRIPLVFLEVFQSEEFDGDVTASVAAWLLFSGVASVVGMNMVVMDETIRLFTRAFYENLAEGKRVGSAMLAGQRTLYENRHRLDMPNYGSVELDDWFVPILYQEKLDPILFIQNEPRQDVCPKPPRELAPDFPKNPPHGFVGRTRESLALERQLSQHKHVVLRGPGGVGKTALAIDTALWLWRLAQFKRLAFVCVEHMSNPRGILAEIAKQLLPDNRGWSVSRFKDESQAIHDLTKQINEPCLIVIDNMESVLPQPGTQAPSALSLNRLLEICRNLLVASPTIKILFTSREPLPKPFEFPCLPLENLEETESIQLVKQTLASELIARPREVTEEQIKSLVDEVGGHARALVLLTKIAAEKGITMVLEHFREVLREMDTLFPQDRQRSLYASLELSIRRLPDWAQEYLPPLSICQSGISLDRLGPLLGISSEKAVSQFSGLLVQVGLANQIREKYLLFDPALNTYFNKQNFSQDVALQSWAEIIKELIDKIYHLQFKDAESAVDLMLLELPNIMAFVQWTQEHWSAEEVITLADRLATFLNRVERPIAQRQIAIIRDEAAKKLLKWNHAAYLSEEARILILKRKGEFKQAIKASEALVDRLLGIDEEFYPQATFDLGTAQLDLAILLANDGENEPSLLRLSQAEESFRLAADRYPNEVENMLAASQLTRGNVLKILGNLTGAEVAFRTAITTYCDDSMDPRNCAIAQCNLGDILQMQNRLDKALEAYEIATLEFEVLKEFHPLATTLHHISIVYQKQGRLRKAESALRKSLRAYDAIDDFIGQGRCLRELGELYEKMGNMDEAICFLNDAIDIFSRNDQVQEEGITRSSLGARLIKLEKLDEARLELEKSISQLKEFGVQVQPWIIWGNLFELEKKAGREKQARTAYRNAVKTYREFRSKDTTPVKPGARICHEVLVALKEDDMKDAQTKIDAFVKSHGSIVPAMVLSNKLVAFINGDKSSALSEDLDLFYMDAVELKLLSEAMTPD